MRNRSCFIVFAAVLVVVIAGAAPRIAAAQVAVSGTVVDAADRAPLPGANVVVTRLGADSTRTGVAAADDGTFRLSLAAGRYRLRVSFVGYTPAEQVLAVGDTAVDLGRVALTADAALGEVVVQGVQERVVVRGDTTAYNADAFKVNPDATAEDLLAKLPGVVVQDGTVQAQGETVRRVLVDGEEFFGDDPAAALRNLPAEIVKEIEVFDRRSDQARFTGFDDGDTEKTINVVTRPGMQNGRFGRVFGGVGTEARYLAGGAVNVFDGTRRISIIGLTNNVNQQNFGMDDLLGVLGSGSNRGGGGGRRGGGGGRRGGGGDGPPGGGFGRGDAGNFLQGEQGGLNTTHALGVNYTDRWGERVRVNGSYFFNLTGNDTDARLERAYFLAGGADQRYLQTTDALSDNAGHRLNLRLEAGLTDATQLIVTPRLSVQQNTSERTLFGLSALETGTLLSQGTNAYTADQLGYTAATDVLVRHRFTARGRSLSLNVGVDLDGRRGETVQDVENLFYDAALPDSTDVYRRRTDSDGTGRTLSASLAYTEPVGARGMLQFSYTPSVSASTSDQDAFRMDPAGGAYTVPDDAYTSASDRQVVRQRGGVSYRYRREGLRASAGVDVQNERLRYEQTGGRAFDVDRNYLSVLPSANVRVDLGEAANLSLSYRPSTDVPGVSQLRDVLDDTNPLLVSVGNPDLRTSTSHRVDVRLRTTRPEAGTTLMGFASLTATRDYIGSAAVVAGADTVTAGVGARGVVLAPGAQLSYPVNLDGYWSARTFVTYGRPVGFLRSNANASLGLTYARTPGLLNGVANRADAVQVDGRFYLGSNVSERLDFSLSYGLSYSTVANTTAAANDGTSFRHRAGLRLDWLPWRGLVLSTDFNLSHYTGLAASVDPTTALWNAGLGYKFLRNDLAEVRLTVTDLLGQNNSVRRDVTGLYVEDSASNALGRYVMLNLTYRLRHFGR